MDPIIGVIGDFLAKLFAKLGGIAFKIWLESQLPVIATIVEKNEVQNLKDIIANNSGSSGLTTEGLVKVTHWFARNLKYRDFIKLVAKRPSQVTVLDHYLIALNSIVQVIEALNRPLVVQGFFHRSDCLTYFYPGVSTIEFSATDTAIMFGAGASTVYVLNSDAAEERLKKLNEMIVNSKTKQLDASEYGNSKRVSSVTEVWIYLVPQQVSGVDFVNDLVDERNADRERIPPDASGLEVMTKSAMEILDDYQQRRRRFDIP